MIFIWTSVLPTYRRGELQLQILLHNGPRAQGAEVQMSNKLGGVAKSKDLFKHSVIGTCLLDCPWHAVILGQQAGRKKGRNGFWEKCTNEEEAAELKKTWRQIGRVTWNLGLYIAHEPRQRVVRALGGWEHSGGAWTFGSCWRTSQPAPWFGPHQELEGTSTEFQAELLV